MREVCKSGAVVAAVVAVLEKQSRQMTPVPKPPPVPPRNPDNIHQCSPNFSAKNSDEPRKPDCTTNIINSNKSDFKNRNTQESALDENYFELAVQDFNSVAEDVEKTFCDDAVAKLNVKSECEKHVGELRRRNCVTIDLKSNDEERKTETSGNRSSSSLKHRAPDTDDLLAVLGYRGNGDIDSDSLERSSDSEGELYINAGLPTITEEERVSGSSAQSFRGCDEDDSSIEDDSTLKDRNQAWSGSVSNQDGSTSDLSTTSSERTGTLGDKCSTRCTNDFQWIRKEHSPLSPPSTSPQPTQSPLRMEEELSHEAPPLSKPPISRSLREKTQRRSNDRSTGPSAPGSLDRRRHPHLKREERDQKSRSSHVKTPPRLDDFQSNLYNSTQNGYCCPPPYEGYFESFHRRHERSDPQRYGSSPMLMEHREHRFSDRGSHPDIYGDCSRYRHEMPCCAYHLGPPPCCFYGGERGYHWTPPPFPKPGEQDEKLRKVQYEKDSLQLQVQVLTEQIEAQSDKISDLEKTLQEKKTLLSDAEEKLQREVLSRSSLETQKLELMSLMSELKLNSASLERENLELRNSLFNNNSDGKKPPVMPRIPAASHGQLTSTPQHSIQGLRVSPSPSPVGMPLAAARNVESTAYQTEILRPKTPPSSYKRQIDVQYGSLPRQQFVANGASNGGMFAMVDNNANPQKKGVAFGRNSSLQHLHMVMGGGRMRGFSVPNLAETEKTVVDGTSSKENSPSSPQLTFNKTKGIKKIFGKMKRSGSGNLEDLPAGIGEFQRGGVRATAAARLGWSEPQLSPRPDKPFAEWDTENICDWLQDLGLDQYIPDAKRWVKNGQQLQESSIADIEKELNVKNPLHKKKLQLALIDTGENCSSDLYLSLAGKLDTAWVLRWLDDAGLPQYKENFLINRVDGRVLHRLTIDDLALLHVTSLLHVASIKRGIQVLRENNYEPSCLQRRSLPDDPDKSTPKQISLWTTHRVMEWLRAVDLAEYAPNLRGAGVHGGLMVLEPKFTADLLASLLSIPPGKTLLRRHLNTHFKELLGKDIIQEKRELEATLGYTPLTPSSKLKVAKKSQFSLKRKKSKGEADYGDLVCPLNADKQSGELSSSGVNMGMMKMENLGGEDVCLRAEKTVASRSLPASVRNSPITQRHV
ncbi:liprin-beta-2 isoform X3 [Dendroctonus ponderosae]|uniref:liprin-beta-2 isoform X3 n=1 Tax=Dendroctonus ponderosae TaxID=77166 RepID=UPI0020363149|nr:liprin-beta-2 isoform X3 [Dendroctonus ponderosae]XP_048517900.1 liprin-beta-2 isoform X3 [Dendroctonus ponderosae]